MEICPTAVVLAPAERIWDLLTDPRKLAQRTGIKVVEGPAGSISAGNHVVLGAGPLRITFDVLDMRPPRQLTLMAGSRLGSQSTNRFRSRRSTLTRAASHTTDTSASCQAGGDSSSRKSSAGGSPPDRPVRSRLKRAAEADAKSPRLPARRHEDGDARAVTPGRRRAAIAPGAAHRRARTDRDPSDCPFHRQAALAPTASAAPVVSMPGGPRRAARP